jgi:predicted nucleic acid-binding protein
MITIDTSVFIELNLNQEKAEQAGALLQAIGLGKIEANVSHFAVHALEAGFRSQKETREFLKNIETSKGLHVYDTSIADEISIAALAEEVGLDFDDAAQYYVARKTDSSSIVSFDRHFDKLKDIPRKEPASILGELITLAKEDQTGLK